MACRVAVIVMGLCSVAAISVSEPTSARAASSITHVVIIDLENHSFDDVLGKLCVEQAKGNVVRAPGSPLAPPAARRPCIGSGDLRFALMASGGPRSVSVLSPSRSMARSRYPVTRSCKVSPGSFRVVTGAPFPRRRP